MTSPIVQESNPGSMSHRIPLDVACAVATTKRTKAENIAAAVRNFSDENDLKYENLFSNGP